MSQKTMQEIKDTLKARKAEINRELKKIEKALAAFQEDKPRPVKRRKKRRKIDTEKVMATVQASPGLSGVQLAKRLRLPTGSTYSALERLQGEQRVVKYGTSWYPTESSSG